MVKKISLLLTIFCVTAGYTQVLDWKLKVDKDGIKVYTKSLPDSKFKAIKIESSIAASATQLVAAIYDINTSAQWVYSTKSATLLKQVSPSEAYYYSEVTLPWPASNRDFVAHLKTRQDARTKIITVNAENVSGLVAVKNDIVRITNSVGQWVITPVSKTNINVVYTLQVDPAGSMPAWLNNMFITKGPMETFKKLRVHVTRPEYQKVQLPFIKD